MYLSILFSRFLKCDISFFSCQLLELFAFLHRSHGNITPKGRCEGEGFGGPGRRGLGLDGFGFGGIICLTEFI